MTNSKHNSLKRWMRGKGILLFGAMLVLWAGGCAHDNRQYVFAGGGPEVFVPKMAFVTTWPLAVLLTNARGFESDFTMTLGDATPPIKLSGQLLVRGGKLRLEGALEQAKRKTGSAGDFGVIWDEAAHQGYVFSEALQGYARISVAVHCTNVATQVMTETKERIEGHPVDRAKVTVTGSDGQAVSVELARALDLGKMPLRIDLINGPQSFALALSKILPIVPGEELFSPPDGFTKYPSETAMLNELTARQLNTAGGKHEHGGKIDTDEPTQSKPRFSNP